MNRAEPEITKWATPEGCVYLTVQWGEITHLGREHSRTAWFPPNVATDEYLIAASRLLMTDDGPHQH